MKVKSIAKMKKNKIPICPKKTKPIKKIIKINNNIPLKKHQKHPSTPLIIYPKKYERKINYKEEFKNDFNINKSNLFHALIPKRKLNSEKKRNRHKVILIKKTKQEKNNKILYSTNSKLETKCDTNSGVNSVFHDGNIKKENSRNIFEFTFSNIYSLKYNNTNKNENINSLVKNHLCNRSNKNYSYQKKNGKTSNKILELKNNNSIKNLKFNNTSNKPNNINEEKNINIKDKKEKNLSKINKTSKISKKFISLIPFDKRNLINKKTNFENDNKNNIDISLTSKNKDKPNQIHRLLLNISPKKCIKINKNNPKINIKHPSLKNLFGI